MTDGERVDASIIFPGALRTAGEAAWRDDVRFFALVYLAAFLFFLILIG